MEKTKVKVEALVEALDKVFAAAVERDENSKKEWMEQVSKNPVHAIEWGALDLVKIEYRERIYKHLTGHWTRFKNLVEEYFKAPSNEIRIELEEIIEDVCDGIQNERSHLLRSAPRHNSSNPMANLIAFVEYEVRVDMFGESLMCSFSVTSFHRYLVEIYEAM